ncbi:MAG: hypothetical protein FJ398_10220 [Verrucomicrobia bacterium]|nr:hypothetical protein [Verrucomicrobiota bacterium]
MRRWFRELRLGCEGQSHEVRKAAAQALGDIGVEAASAKSALSKATRDEFPSVREAAFRALGRVVREETPARAKTKNPFRTGAEGVLAADSRLEFIYDVCRQRDGVLVRHAKWPGAAEAVVPAQFRARQDVRPERIIHRGRDREQLVMRARRLASAG